jgi:hypothetical protein
MLLPAQIAISGPKYAGDIHPFYEPGLPDKLFLRKTNETLSDLRDSPPGTTDKDARIKFSVT